ncbi:oxidoreductase [Streptomyces abyssalis]|uniref:Oxidoreductase n=1 Tax=Streptomyces abyssalis TaxID=933944 RepID=A0A1E7JJJ7_9ACTN|nr:Gfo/Idh/MocA family oxidoreductase [Streptomyces abyssalis]OEU87281.1 oxidoreductase [Streptomyces abyssalis]OEU87813.1 oxidoreductase [Streptomyces abyssalis]OEV29149.1 oxidoreductase [Streptomyces nanshensis]
MPSERTPLRAAVVGTGGIVSGSHLPALREQSGRVRLVGAVDVDEGRLADFLGEAGDGVSGYPGLTEMLAAEEPDLVLIGTPPAFHAEQAVASLRAGAWVLCEKPLCLSLAEYDTIAEAEGDGTGGPYASVVFQHRYGSGALHARELLRAGELGTPLVAHCQTTWHRDAGYYSVPWRGRWETEGGGPTMGHGIHQMDLLLHLLGEWSEIRAMAGRLVHDVESEDVSTALVRFESGAMATVVNSVLSPDEVSRIRIDCTDATVELTHLYGYGNDDWAYTPAPHAREQQERTSHWHTPAADVPSSHKAQLDGFLDAMEKGERPPGSGRDARRTLEFLAALYKSAFTGAPVHQGEIAAQDPFYRAMHGNHPDWAPKEQR